MTDMQKIVAEIDAGLSAPPVPGSASHQQIMSNQAHARLLRKHWPAIRSALLASPAVPDGVCGYCTDCEQLTTIHNGRCSCGSGRWVYRVSAAPKPPTQGWQPIETAPKDGTIFDAWFGDGDATDIDFYCLDPKSRRSPDWRWFNGKFRPVGGIGAPVFIQPTHWMPLPTPPAVEGE